MSREYTHEIKLEADQAAVWAALTEAGELGRWLVEVARVEPRVGGVYELNFGDGVQLQSHIETWEPGRHLRIFGPGPIIQEYTLEKDGESTTLRVVTSGIPDSPGWDGFVEGGRRGWEISLRGLLHNLQHHRGQARQMTRLRFDTPLAVADSWERATGALRLGSDLDAALLVSVAGFGLLAEITKLDRAVLALGIQPTSAGSQVWLALSTYGGRVPPADTVEQWSRQLEQTLAVAPVGTTRQNPQELHGHG